MKRDLVLRNLHMGCGEGLVGRVRRPPVDRPRAVAVHGSKTTGRQAGKDRR